MSSTDSTMTDVQASSTSSPNDFLLNKLKNHCEEILGVDLNRWTYPYQLNFTVHEDIVEVVAQESVLKCKKWIVKKSVVENHVCA